ncbi:MAG: thioredoxin [Bacteroidetes bacterium CG12_big_fil_rev_8_21_14_0_65_60_17]|nr:MAG: thioredoxin [Bacteroidetes bacterium CG12_big_fil_rev_8_21_14_0_65_60_17]
MHNHETPTETHNRNTQPKRRSRLRLLAEAVAIVGIFAFFRFSDTGTTAQGWLQQAVLATGLFQADVNWAEEKRVPANFDVDLVTLDGQPVSLSRFKGKPIFMNIWATWCPPCLAEMPYIEALYQDVQDEDIIFVMISTDDTAQEAKLYMEQKGFTLPVYRLAGPLPEPYTSRVLPTTYVIGSDGTLGTVHSGMANYNKPGFKKYLRSLSTAGQPRR